MASNDPWADSVYSVASGLLIPMTPQPEGRRSGLPIPPQSPATPPQSGLLMDQLDLDQLEPTNNWTSNQLQQLPDEHKSGKEAEYDALSVQGGEDPWKGSVAEDAGSSWTSLRGTNNWCKQPKRKSKELRVISKAKQVETDGQVAAIPPKCLNLVDGKALGSNWVSCSHCCLEWPQWDVGTVCPYCCKQLVTV